MVVGGKPERFFDRVGYKGGVISPLWHVTFVTRQYKQMLEIKVSRLKHSHDLQTYGRFAMVGYSGSSNKLVEQSLIGDYIDF